IKNGPFFIPDFETALLHDWEEKLEKLALVGSQTQDVVMIGGVPTWTVVLFNRILELTGKDNMLEVWPDFQVYIHGGVSFKPYRKTFESFFPSNQVDYQEVYNASEGYFAVQNDFSTDDMLLLLDNGIYYEFLPMDQWDSDVPKAVPLWEVELDKHYALIISTNSGLWRYKAGDTVMFTQKNPYKIKITGRIKQFINAFGEEVVIENTDTALAEACKATKSTVVDYTVAPMYLTNSNRGGHEWLIEFEHRPKSLKEFGYILDRKLQEVNSDYQAKRYKDIALKPLEIVELPKDTFHAWLRKKGKLGGQHKVPRLSNDRKYVNEIIEFMGQWAG
ncbi:MAG: GH3 auxin-responsive promoter family protein, partial [Bacteroidota bacterium]